MKTTTISYIGHDRTVEFAASELTKYMSLLLGHDVPVTQTDAVNEEAISVGLIADMPELAVPDVTDPALDDAIAISVHSGKGIIAGINPRSVLIAVYRYLTEQGCRWVRPGVDGEYVPKVDHLRGVTLAETPSYRHRGICIEGAVSVDHVRNIIDWMPKLGYNGYFTQFRESYTFFDRWYSHEGNPLVKGEHISVADAQRYLANCVDEIGKRGLLYHAVGHGWTCEPFGISGLSWDSCDVELDEATTQFLAEVKGERKLWGGVPLNTNLCYGNPEVRRRIVEDIADYSVKNPHIDIMHFWLADGSNNHCECPLCCDTRPSDLYVQMLNELDELLSSRNIPVKIVFLIYVDLLWPPVKYTILNPDRFILMFAPITRTYSSPLAIQTQPLPLAPFVRNELEMPKSVEENVAFLQSWQQDCPCDSFDFDYHLMWDHYKDPGYYNISELINQDVKMLQVLGLNGFVSCQTQRACFPTGLPMVTLGQTLWDNLLSFDAIANDYFKSAYGADGKQVQAYLSRLSELFDPVHLRREKPAVSPESALMFQIARQVILDFQPVIEEHLSGDISCWNSSWHYLKHHAEISLPLADALFARASGDKEKAHEIWLTVANMAQEREEQLNTVLDVWLFVGTLSGLFRK